MCCSRLEVLIDYQKTAKPRYLLSFAAVHLGRIKLWLMSGLKDKNAQINRTEQVIEVARQGLLGCKCIVCTIPQVFT